MILVTIILLVVIINHIILMNFVILKRYGSKVAGLFNLVNGVVIYLGMIYWLVGFKKLLANNLVILINFAFFTYYFGS